MAEENVVEEVPQVDPIRQAITLPAVPVSPFVDEHGKLREDVEITKQAHDLNQQIRRTILAVDPDKDAIIDESGNTVEVVREGLRTGTSPAGDGRLGEGASSGAPSPDSIISDRRFQQVGTTVSAGVVQTSIIDGRVEGRIVSDPNDLIQDVSESPKAATASVKPSAGTTPTGATTSATITPSGPSSMAGSSPAGPTGTGIPPK